MPYPPIATTPNSAISRYDHGASDDGSALGLAVAVGPLVDWLVVVDVAAASESPTITTPDMPGWR